jgi:UPF0271 protein
MKSVNISLDKKMNSYNKLKTYILDTCAFLSGKPIDLQNAKIVTTTEIEKELKPGGRDYQNYQYLKEKGLILHKPNKESIKIIENASKKTGDFERLSKIDIEILALAYDFLKNEESSIILTDDYSIQNVAENLKLRYQSINQKGISKRFKWINRCRGCGKKFKDNISICPICGGEIKKIVSSNKDIKNY